MKKSIKPAIMVAKYGDAQGSGKEHVFYMKKDRFDQDCQDTCVHWLKFKILGYPEELSDDERTAVYEGTSSRGVKIGSVFGCLVLCREILDQGEDPYRICDDVDADLEYMMSALVEDAGPMNPFKGDPYQDVFYIHTIEFETGYQNLRLKKRIVKEIPDILLSLENVRPTVLAYYPSPLEDQEEDEAYQEKSRILSALACDKVEARIPHGLNDASEEPDSKRVKRFGQYYRFTDDEVNIVLGRRNSYSYYEETRKNLPEFHFFESCGFQEIGDSRLLFIEIV